MNSIISIHGIPSASLQVEAIQWGRFVGRTIIVRYKDEQEVIKSMRMKVPAHESNEEVVQFIQSEINK